jgi:flagellar protein FlaG
MQIAKISMDAASHAQPAERIRLVKGAGNRPDEAKRLAPESAAPVHVKADAEQIRQEQDVASEDFIQTIEKANKRYDVYDKLLQFSIHEDTRQIMIKIINTKTEEVIAEIPPEKILDMIAQLWEMAGLLVDKRA